ncbi:MAG: glycogen synthase GlgA [Candidatus Zixiibacteriota bacterium]|nr:MAG: glycogen synthase GlgA [candidate division Zixibacteria bacterium]
MKILVAASEMAPFAKTGGLGDVLGALPRAFAGLGHEVKTFIPRYSSIDENIYPLQPLDWSLDVPVEPRPMPMTVEVLRDKKRRLESYFIDNEDYFDRRELYRDSKTGADYADNDERFIFFAHGVLEAIKKIDWKPDVIHVHDWQAGLIPVYLKTIYAGDSFLAGIRTVLTVHNLAYQGVFDKERFPKLNLPDDLFHPTAPFEFYGKVNFLKAAILFADKITTVSPQYAMEIQSSEELGCGLQGVLRERRDDLTGILNGVDYAIWSPSRDKNIPYRYHINNLSGKQMNKVELLGEAKMPIRAKTPLIGVISRLVDQKGFDLIADAAEQLFELNIQMVLLGTGEEKYHRLFKELEKKYPGKLRVYLTFDEALAHRIEAASDIFLMPSRFEPCGLNQMYSLKYGTVPLVREVGGLVDTVIDYNPESGEGTGFVFHEYTPEALVGTVRRAVELFAKKRRWTKLMKAGMRQDFSWVQSAQKYTQLFEQLANG